MTEAAAAARSGAGAKGDLASLVHDVVAATRSRHAVHDALDTALSVIEHVLRPTWSAVWLFDSRTDTWFISHSRNLSSDARELRFGRGSAIPCLVGEQGVSRRYDTLDDETLFTRTHEEHYRMQSALYVPLAFLQRPVGVVALYSDRPAHFTDQEQQQLEVAAAYLSYLVTALSNAGEHERALELDARDRLAQDLHDGMLQTLSSLRLYVSACKDALADEDHAEVDSIVEALARTVERAIREVRSSIAGLRSVTVLEAVDEMLQRVRRRLEAAGVTVEAQCESLSLEPLTSDALAAVVRETSNNVLKHSGADSVFYSLYSRDGAAILECLDNGRGPAGTPDGAPHLGLTLLAERVSVLSGELTYSAPPSGGFRVTCTIPLGRSA